MCSGAHLLSFPKYFVMHFATHSSQSKRPCTGQKYISAKARRANMTFVSGVCHRKLACTSPSTSGRPQQDLSPTAVPMTVTCHTGARWEPLLLAHLTIPEVPCHQQSLSAHLQGSPHHSSFLPFSHLHVASLWTTTGFPGSHE